MLNILLFFFVLWFSMPGIVEQEAPGAEFSGEATVRMPADYVIITLTVKTECEKNPKNATSATDEVANKIYTYLEKYKSTPHFKLLVDGGFTSPFSRFFKDHEYCRNTFQKETRITLHLAITKDLDKIFGSIQSFALSQFAREVVNNSDIAQTYVTIASPSPQLTEKHRKNMSLEALNLAVQDAIDKFKAATKSCKLRPFKIRDIREKDGFSERPVRFYAKAAPGAGRAADAKEISPIEFDSLEVSKTVVVSFQVDDGLCHSF